MNQNLSLERSLAETKLFKTSCLGMPTHLPCQKKIDQQRTMLKQTLSNVIAMQWKVGSFRKYKNFNLNAQPCRIENCMKKILASPSKDSLSKFSSFT